jgi:hypothetical protein
MEIQYSQLKINHLNNTPSTKAAGGRIVVCFSKDVKVPVKVRRTLSSVGTSSSNTEAEYIAMSQSLRLQDILPIMFLLQEIQEKGFSVIHTKPYVYCKVFEDNVGTLELARLPKL